jgi:phosphoenolpyruvate-protein kinase (PTS system EI component)
VFDERDEAVRTLVAQAIQHARGLGRKIGLCGQAPSDYPEFARFLVECGIDSMSLNPDAVLRTTRQVLEVEAERASDGHEPAKGSPGPHAGPTRSAARVGAGVSVER